MKKIEIQTGTAKSGSSFVGIKIKDNKVDVRFPMGYHLSERSHPEFSDEERKDVRNLIYVIEHCSSKNEGDLVSRSDNSNDFPLRACLNIIEYYLKYQSFYTSTITGYKSDIKGKANFKRTIKVDTPHLQDEDSFIYLKRQVAYKQNQKNLLITEIHKWCTYECFKRMGWLYCNFIPPKSVLRDYDKNKKLYIKIVSDELKHTFNDDRKLLFNSMIHFIQNTGNSNDVFLTYGTNNFECVWEKLIDSVFGVEKKQDKFFPQATWYPHFPNEEESKRSQLRPDCIMKVGQDYYILDAKYYSYGIGYETLPQTSDVNKQITYAEKASKENGDANVYNAFLMPFDKSDNRFRVGNPILNVGEFRVDWYNQEEYKGKTYSTVKGILLDTKSLMDSFISRDTADLKGTLAKNIQEAIHF